MRPREIAQTMSTWGPLPGITLAPTAAHRSHAMWDPDLDC
jgi:hypothetical protein